MPPYLSPFHIVEPSLPAHCEPANEFLRSLSITFHTCVPTNLALLSTVLGTCSIISWLWAQLPQIYKNYKLKSTSGLSFFFLAEWLLGDVTNLLGCLFTGQASWQIIIAAYYVFVDCCLCSQWMWYELLHHGRPLRPIWGRWRSGESDNAGNGSPGMHEVVKSNNASTASAGGASNGSADQKASPKATPVNTPPRSNAMNGFRIPNFARSSSVVKESWQETFSSGTPSDRNVRRVAASSSPMPSPKTVLYITLILAVLTNPSIASPVFPLTTTAPLTPQSTPTTQILGKIFSWSSTFLYLGSRLPQIYKNQVRKSTAGLSPALFAAAFFGNLFYSSSLLTNPCAWYDFAPGEGSGWVDSAGSVRREWVIRAAPFFLGAAGVLLMDAAVGLQFWIFKDNDEPRGRSRVLSDDIIITFNDHGVERRRKLHWRRVSGWMRGWAPAVSVAATPATSRAATPIDGGLNRDSSPGRGSSKSIPIHGQGQTQGDALDEARALLGTSSGRYASPRSYGAVIGSPR